MRSGQTASEVLLISGQVEQPRVVVMRGVIHVHMQVPILVMDT